MVNSTKKRKAYDLSEGDDTADSGTGEKSMDEQEEEEGAEKDNQNQWKSRFFTTFPDFLGGFGTAFFWGGGLELKFIEVTEKLIVLSIPLKKLHLQ